MGWDNCPEWRSRQSAVDGIRRELAHGGGPGKRNRIVAESVRGSQYWLAVHPEGVPTPVVVLALLGQSNGRWGYRLMDEYAGPSYYDCPQFVLDAAGEPEPWGYAQHWREQVARVRQGLPPVAAVI